MTWLGYDLVHFEEEDADHDTHSDHFMSLCRSCATAGVKLRNVDPRLLRKSDISQEDIDTVAKAVESLKHQLCPRIFQYQLASLEAIQIKTSWCDLPDMSELQRNPPNWPQLMGVTFVINSSDEDNLFERCEFLLLHQHRPNTTELSVEWEVFKKDNPHQFKIPCATRLTGSMPHLTTLEIIGCLAPEAFFLTLWRGPHC